MKSVQLDLLSNSDRKENSDVKRTRKSFKTLLALNRSINYPNILNIFLHISQYHLKPQHQHTSDNC